jgi:hypothetical protein
MVLVGAAVMDKLQDLLDVAFGKVTGTKPPLEPNEFTLERQRAFEESARKIEALRRARLARSEPGH